MGTAAQAVIDIDLQGDDAKAELTALSGAMAAFAARAETVFYTVGAFIAVDKIRDSAVEMLGAFTTIDKAATKLNTTLQTTGNTTGFTTEALADMRASFMDVSTASEETLATVQNTFARTKVISGDIFEDATQTALDFAAAMSMDVAGAAEELSEAMMDPANELEKFRRFGITFTDAEKAMLAQMQSTGKGAEAQRYVLDRLNKVVGGQAAAAAGTMAGQQEQLANKLEVAKASLGSMIAEGLEPMYPLLSGLIDAFSGWLPVIEEVATGLIGGVNSLLEWLTPLETTGTAVLEWAALVQSVFERWDDYIAVALLNAGANVIAFADEVAHWFTDVIPTYAKSLYIVMKDIFFQLGDIISTVVTNIAKNIEDFWGALQAVMRGEMPEFTPTSLLEGFELKLSELPEVTKRSMSETEKVMRQAADDLSTELGADVAAKTEFKIKEAEKREKIKLAEQDKKTTNESLTLGGAPVASSTGSTEGLLALSSRIEAAAGQVKLETAVGNVATQQMKTNELLTKANDMVTEPLKVNVDVKQDAVVTAIKEQTAAIVKATELQGTFT